MKIVRIIRERDHKILFDRVERADSFWTRFVGLQCRNDLAKGEGLLLVPGTSIHMLFMRMSIDAVFLNKDHEVLHISRDLKPWRGTATAKGAKKVLEVRSGEAYATGLAVGQKLIIEEV